MSYTIPEYVDTPEQAILAVASAVKGEQVTGGDGSVNRALDILADTLAETDVTVPQTDAGAILALAQYVSGGGGVTLGAPGAVYSDGAEPTIGGYYVFHNSAHFAMLGESVVVSGPIDSVTQTVQPTGPYFAAGLTIGMRFPAEYTTPPVYRVSFDEQTEQYTAVADWSSNITRTDADGIATITFTMPELQSNEAIVFYLAD